MATCPVCQQVFQVPALPANSPGVDLHTPSRASLAMPPTEPSPAEAADTAREAPLGITSRGGVLLAAFLLGCLCATLVGLMVWKLHDDRPQAPLTIDATAEPRDDERSWRVVQHFSGSGSAQTKQFRITSSRWRIHWAAEGQGAVQNNFAIMVCNPAGTQLATALSIVGSGSDIAYVNTPPGRYLLDVLAIDTRWEVTIEQATERR
jgi:hypothetical protein